MKAEDIVMSFERIQEIDLKNAESNFKDALMDVAREQAEISFKAGQQLALEKQGQAYLEGKQAGVKEVVEWLINYNLHQFPVPYDSLWHSKLKEWGVE